MYNKITKNDFTLFINHNMGFSWNIEFARTITNII